MQLTHQLRHLLDMAELRNITIQVMPILANPHPGMVGPFHIVRFPRPWPTVVSVETILGGTFALPAAQQIQREPRLNQSRFPQPSVLNRQDQLNASTIPKPRPFSFSSNPMPLRFKGGRSGRSSGRRR
ncbi:DUF5753 domain-containing protein (plasmid) [Streptomyces sp. NBC_01426]|uniref:Scr1 family TA system antitoxin-like transcriptional regulator n=1 Tax=Streptomyces sp. NBC_01426 TaxID=2975866 RepID=UPI002E334AAF|nr:Scr1 family TA system antitoxin-like transcriptional regulator [Streptomyces sp. NBC_01426]